MSQITLDQRLKYISEAETLRRLNLSQSRAGRLRDAGVLTPDFILCDGRLKLYNPERLPALGEQITKFASRVS